MQKQEELAALIEKMKGTCASALETVLNKPEFQPHLSSHSPPSLPASLSPPQVPMYNLYSRAIENNLLRPIDQWKKPLLKAKKP